MQRESSVPRRTAARLLAVVLVPGLLVACGDASGPSGSADATIEMTSSSSGYGSGTSFGFSPRVDTVSVGDTVAWTNGTSDTHTVTHDGGAWESGDISGDGSYTRAFQETGEYGYHCTYHGSAGSGMYGTIVVE